MLKKRNLWILGLVVAVTSFTQLNAQGGRMIRLGDAHVDGSTDHDSINVGRSDGPFRAIQLRVSGGDVNFERVIVRYGDGSLEAIPVRSRIPNGGRTRIIDLPGARRIHPQRRSLVQQGPVDTPAQSYLVRASLKSSATQAS